MKTKFQYLLLCCVSAILLPIYADDNIYTDPRIQITVPSTEAQSLGTFAEIPVDLHTGRTNINIPLLTISYFLYLLVTMEEESKLMRKQVLSV